jgi:hypothetical protein
MHGSCYSTDTHVAAGIEAGTSFTVLFPHFLECRSVCASVYRIPAADACWVAAVAQQLRRSAASAFNVGDSHVGGGDTNTAPVVSENDVSESIASHPEEVRLGLLQCSFTATTLGSGATDSQRERDAFNEGVYRLPTPMQQLATESTNFASTYSAFETLSRPRADSVRWTTKEGELEKGCEGAVAVPSVGSTLTRHRGRGVVACMHHHQHLLTRPLSPETALMQLRKRHDALRETSGGATSVVNQPEGVVQAASTISNDAATSSRHPSLAAVSHFTVQPCEAHETADKHVTIAAGAAAHTVDGMRVVHAALTAATRPPSATGALRHRHFIRLRVHSSALAWGRRQRHRCERTWLMRSMRRRDKWTWWCHMLSNGAVAGTHTEVNSEETLIVTDTNNSYTTACEDEVCKGTETAPVEHADLCNVNRMIACNCTYLPGRNDGRKVRGTAVLWTPATINKLWKSMQQCVTAQIIRDQKRRAETAHREYVAAAKAIPISATTDVAEMLPLLHCVRGYRSQDNETPLGEPPILACWRGRLFSLAPHHGNCGSLSLTSFRVGSGEECADLSTQRADACRLVHEGAAAQWRSASWLPWETRIRVACRDAGLPLLLTTAKCTLCQRSSAAAAARRSRRWSWQVQTPTTSLHAREALVCQLNWGEALLPLISAEAGLPRTLHRSGQIAAAVTSLPQVVTCQQADALMLAAEVRSHALAELRSGRCCCCCHTASSRDGEEREKAATVPQRHDEDRKRRRSESSDGTQMPASLLIDDCADHQRSTPCGREGCVESCASATPSPSQRSVERAVLGTDSSLELGCVAIPKTEEAVSLEDLPRNHIDVASQREAALQQRQHARVSRLLLSSALGLRASSRSLTPINREDNATRVRKRSSSSGVSRRVRLACAEARCRAYMSERRGRGEGHEACEDVSTLPQPSFAVLQGFLLSPPSPVTKFSYRRAARRHLRALEPEGKVVVAEADAETSTVASPPLPDVCSRISGVGRRAAADVTGSASVSTATSVQRPSWLSCDHVRHELLMKAAREAWEKRGATTPLVLCASTLTHAQASLSEIFPARRGVMRSSELSDEECTAGQQNSVNGPGLSHVSTTASHLPAYWPVFTLRNFAADRLRHTPCETAAAVGASPQPSSFSSITVSANVDTVRSTVTTTRTALLTCLPLRILQWRHARYRAVRHALHRHLLATDPLLHPSTFAIGSTGTTPSTDSLACPTALAGLRYHRELMQDDATTLDRCTRSLLLAHAQTMACLGAFASLDFHWGRTASHAAAVALRRRPEEPSSALNSLDQRRSALAGGTSSVWPAVTSACSVGVDMRGVLDCSRDFYARLVHRVVYDGMRRDGSLLFHTHWCEALAGCLGLLSPPQSCLSGSVHSQRAADDEVDGAASSFHTRHVTGQGSVSCASCEDEHAAAGVEVRWFVDTDDDDDDDAGEDEGDVRGAAPPSSFPPSTRVQEGHNKQLWCMTATRKAAVASARFLFCFVSGDRHQPPKSLVHVAALRQADCFFDIDGAGVFNVQARASSGSSSSSSGDDLHQLLRAHAAQLLSGGFQCADDDGEGDDAGSALGSATRPEMEREVQLLRRRRYTRHVFALCDERRFLLVEARARWMTQCAALCLPDHLEVCVPPSAAADAELRTTEGVADDVLSEALRTSVANSDDAAAEQCWLGLRRRTHHQHMRIPAGPLWPHKRWSAIPVPLLAARRADAEVHYIFHAYAWRDRSATLGAVTNAAVS